SDSTPVVLTATNTQGVAVRLVSATWSGSTTLPSGLSAVLADALLPAPTNSTGSTSGSVSFTFSAPDKNFDFLAAGEMLTAIYNVTATGIDGLSSTRKVTIVIAGTNDAPVLAA